jgi:hypothetical protein
VPTLHRRAHGIDEFEEGRRLADAAERRKGLLSGRLLTMRPEGGARANYSVRFVIDLVLCLVGCAIALIWKRRSRVRFIVRPLAQPEPSKPFTTGAARVGDI